MRYVKLFEPLQIGRVTLKNRIAMAPMGTLWPGFVEDNGRLTQRVIDYYVERAYGGCGLIITGINRATDLEPIACPYVSPATQSSFSELAEQVHYYGTRVFAQLTAGWGRVLYAMWGAKPFSASSVPAFWQPEVMTRELSLAEIESIVSSLGQAARLLREAGIDGVELHGHEGYLIDQFATSLWNKRQDKYGGGLENRLRFAFEILNAIKSAAGADFPVVYRFGLKHYVKGPGAGALKGEKFLEAGRDIPEGLEMAKKLEKAGFDALHVDAGCYDSWYWSHPPVYQPHGSLVEMAARVKKITRLPVISVGRLDIPDLAEQVIREDRADIIAIGRGLLADPHWPKKVQAGQVEDIRPCYGCWDGCLGRGVNEHKPTSCSLNPATGRERLYVLNPVDRPTRVLVAGGGIAGMEAARVSALRGCRVTLYEKGLALGGHLLAASVPDFKEDLRRVLAWYKLQLERLGVEIKLDLVATPGLIKEGRPDRVIIATGSTPIVPDVPGIDSQRVVDCQDLLLGRRKSGPRAVVVGGGLVGCETALWLIQQGLQVTVIEQKATAAADVFIPSRLMLLNLLKYHQAPIMTGTRLAEVTDAGVLVSTDAPQKQLLECDTVALAAGLKPDRQLYEALRGDIGEIYAVGDCQEPRKIKHAVWDAYHVASR